MVFDVVLCAKKVLELSALKVRSWNGSLRNPIVLEIEFVRVKDWVFCLETSLNFDTELNNENCWNGSLKRFVRRFIELVRDSVAVFALS